MHQRQPQRRADARRRRHQVFPAGSDSFYCRTTSIPRMGGAGHIRRDRWAWMRTRIATTELISETMFGSGPTIASASRRTSARRKFWYSNDRDGLDGKGALALAEALQKEVDLGARKPTRCDMHGSRNCCPMSFCRICEGTGVRTPSPYGGAGDLREGGIGCNSCEGAGYVPAWATHYPFSTENVTEFIAFLRDSGGFSIS